jgi:hypothetical protein
MYEYLQEKPIYNAYAYKSEVPVRSVSENETEGKCYCSGRSRTLMVAIPKKLAQFVNLEDGDTIRMKYNNKDGTLVIKKYLSKHKTV